MRFGLTPILSLHWALVFSLLAFGMFAGEGATTAPLLGTLGLAVLSGNPGGAMLLLHVGLAASLVFAALMFAWSALAQIAEHEPAEYTDTLAMAYGGAVVSLTLVLLAGASNPAGGLYSVVAIQLGALAVSFLVSYAERFAAMLGTEPQADDVRAAARLMAMGAAHGAMLSRLAGRDGPIAEKVT